MEKIIKNSWLLVVLILIIAGFLRFYDITKTPPGFYPDEAIYANNGIEAWETDHFKAFYPENYGREGLWPNIIGFFIVKLGHEPWVPRSVAAVFGVLTVLGVYFLAKELFGNNELEIKNYRNEKLNHNSLFIIHYSNAVALLSAFLIATSFWHINFSRIGFRAIMAPFFLVWTIYFLLLALRQIKEQKPPKFYIINSIFSGIFYGLGFHTYIAYRATPLLILLILFFYWLKNKEKAVRKKILLSTLCFLLVTIIVAAPLIFYFINNPQDFFGRTSQISIFSSDNPIKALLINTLKTAGMFNFAGDYNWRHNYAGRPELFWPVGILFLSGIFLGIKAIIKRKQGFVFAALFGWFLIAALPVVVSNESLPHALRAILMIPPVFILAGAGGIRLYEFIAVKIKNKKVFNFIVLVFLSLLVFEAYVSYFILWGRNPNVAANFNQSYVAIGRQLNALPKELPKYVIVRAPGVDVRGLPIPAQTVMYMTDSSGSEKQKEKNIFYILPEQINQIPKNSYTIILK